MSLERKEQKELLIEPHHLGDAQNGDEVVVKRVIAKRGRASAKVIMVLNYAHINSIIYLKKRDDLLEAIDIRTSLPLQVNFDDTNLSILEDGTLFLIDARSREVLKFLGKMEDARVDEKLSLILYDRADDKFPEDSINQANSIPLEVKESEIQNRVDLRDLDFCTIDPVTAKDFDDAIFWDEKNNTLYVAIADVSYYVEFFTPIDKEAKMRGFTTYLPHKAFPMLPRELSENICSLKPNVDRLAFVCKIELDKNLNPKKRSFLKQ